MVVQQKLYTASAFWEFTRQPENQAKRLALIDGIIVEMPPSSQKNTVIAMRIGYLMNAHVIPNNLGYVTGPDGGFTLDEYNARQPDVAFISKARHPVLEGVEFPIAPDLAVEVISPSESSTDVLRKVQTYVRAGTRLVLTVYGDDEVVYAWRSAEDGGLHMQSFEGDDTLDCGDALPGFILRIADIFPK
ncbi:MAG: Uma2 family endonuclease [Anaerolineae bacterium]|jgi:Uma2 family endonuclease|nr:Uma2 family endonuclease [Anaerolineae bacterium]